MYNFDILMGGSVVSLGCYSPGYLLISSYIPLERWGWGKGRGVRKIVNLALFTLLEFMIIWCNMQEIINPLFLHCVGDGGRELAGLLEGWQQLEVGTGDPILLKYQIKTTGTQIYDKLAMDARLEYRSSISEGWGKQKKRIKPSQVLFLISKYLITILGPVLSF